MDLLGPMPLVSKIVVDDTLPLGQLSLGGLGHELNSVKSGEVVYSQHLCGARTPLLTMAGSVTRNGIPNNVYTLQYIGERPTGGTFYYGVSRKIAWDCTALEFRAALTEDQELQLVDVSGGPLNEEPIYLTAQGSSPLNHVIDGSSLLPAEMVVAREGYTGMRLKSVETGTGDPVAMLLSPDGERIVIASNTSTPLITTYGFWSVNEASDFKFKFTVKYQNYSPTSGAFRAQPRSGTFTLNFDIIPTKSLIGNSSVGFMIFWPIDIMPTIHVVTPPIQWNASGQDVYDAVIQGIATAAQGTFQYRITGIFLDELHRYVGNGSELRTFSGLPQLKTDDSKGFYSGTTLDEGPIEVQICIVPNVCTLPFNPPMVQIFSETPDDLESIQYTSYVQKLTEISVNADPRGLYGDFIWECDKKLNPLTQRRLGVNCLKLLATATEYKGIFVKETSAVSYAQATIQTTSPGYTLGLKVGSVYHLAGYVTLPGVFQTGDPFRSGWESLWTPWPGTSQFSQAVPFPDGDPRVTLYDTSPSGVFSTPGVNIAYAFRLPYYITPQTASINVVNGIVPTYAFRAYDENFDLTFERTMLWWNQSGPSYVNYCATPCLGFEDVPFFKLSDDSICFYDGASVGSAAPTFYRYTDANVQQFTLSLLTGSDAPFTLGTRALPYPFPGIWPISHVDNADYLYALSSYNPASDGVYHNRLTRYDRNMHCVNGILLTLDGQHMYPLAITTDPYRNVYVLCEKRSSMSRIIGQPLFVIKYAYDTLTYIAHTKVTGTATKYPNASATGDFGGTYVVTVPGYMKNSSNSALTSAYPSIQLPPSRNPKNALFKMVWHEGRIIIHGTAMGYRLASGD